MKYNLANDEATALLCGLPLKFCGCILLQCQKSVGACTRYTRSNAGPVVVILFDVRITNQSLGIFELQEIYT